MPRNVAISFRRSVEVDDRHVAALLHRHAVIVSNNNDLSTTVSTAFDELEISFRHGSADERPGFSVSGLALLALIARRVAESGRRVRIVMPADAKGRRDGLQWFLANLEFAELFGGATNSWSRFVDVQGTIPPVRHDDAPGDSHYVPFRWYDATWFDSPVAGGDWFSVEPRVNAYAAKRLGEMLAARFLDPDAVDLFTRVMFLEVAWNTVLHSCKAPGLGYGIVGSQMRSSSAASRKPVTTTLSFCIADAGLGIAHTLQDYYASSGKSYEVEYQCSKAAAILRASVDPDSTSRRAFPNDAYKSSDRGLARVADAARPSERLEFGALSVCSGAGRLSLTGQGVLVRPQIEDIYGAFPLPGVTVVAQLTLRRRPVEHPTRAPVSQVLEPLILSPRAVLNEPFRTRAIHGAPQFVVVDVAYGDSDVRDIESIARASVDVFSQSTILLWNVRTQLAQLGALAMSLPATRGALAIVRSYAEVGLLSVTHEGASPVDALFTVTEGSGGGLRRAAMSAEAYFSVSSQVNTRYLRDGFAARDVDRGFFVGLIHLLTGTVVSQYFALPRNAAFDEGLRRWATTCEAALNLILTHSNVPVTETVVLGLPGSIRDVLQYVWDSDSLSQLAAHTLMSYDVPTSDEIAPIVERHSAVIFVTDVVSSASLLTEARRIVQKLGKRVLGMIALVDARATKSTTPIPGTQFITGGAIDVLPGDHATNGPHYWVDPVSLVPSARQLFGHAIDSRIEDTLDVLADSGAVRCGHVVDGQRHMSTYVDMATFIDSKRDWLAARLRAEFMNRLSGRGWSDFEPEYVLFPAGIARIDAINRKGDSEVPLTAYRTGVSRYLPLLADIWPKARAVPVSRAFDPAGRPRCARVLEDPKAHESLSPDVVIADDCLWSGRSADQLVSIAIARGAGRIFVVPLLARLAHEDFEHWESLQAVTLPGGARAEVCFAFPMVLPIPHYSAEECPYEITDSRLRRWTGRSPALEAEEARARAELVGHAPQRSVAKGPLYTRTWLRVRAYAELAGVDESALDALATIIRDSHSSEARLSLLELFLEEWSITGRSRLRQTIRPLLRDIATSVVRDDAATPRELIAACSLLRSIYPERFVEALGTAVDRIGGNVDQLGRLLLQVSSLPEPLRRQRQVIESLRTISARSGNFDLDSAGHQEEAVERLASLFVVCDQLQLPEIVAPPAPTTPRTTAIALLDFLLHNATLTHEAWPWFQSLGTEAPRAYSAETFRTIHEKWLNSHQPIIMEQMLPLIVALEPQILLTISKLSRVANRETDYFTDVGASTSPFVRDISSFGFALRLLSERADRPLLLATLGDAAQRLAANAFSKESRLVATLREMQGLSVDTIVEGVRSELQATVVASRAVSVTVERRDVGLEGRSLFGPADVIHAALTTVVDNVRRHAFSGHEVTMPAVLVEVSPFSDGSEQGVSMRIFDNGRTLDPLKRPSDTSRRAAADLERFDGRLHSPNAADDSRWSVVQQLDLLAW